MRPIRAGTMQRGTSPEMHRTRVNVALLDCARYAVLRLEVRVNVRWASGVIYVSYYLIHHHVKFVLFGSVGQCCWISAREPKGTNLT